MIVEQIAVGMLEVNCYIVGDETSRSALIVDPGDDGDWIVDRVRELGLTPTGVLLTHGHVDHIRGVSRVCEEFAIPVELSPDDHDLYHSPDNQLPPWLPAAKGLPEPASVPMDQGGLAFRVLLTPGHTPGGRSYYFPSARSVFTGDALFAGGIGRTDLPGGNEAQLMQSIQTVLFALPDDTVVYPGHGGPTTIGKEKALHRR